MPSLAYISAATNRFSHAAHMSPNSVVAFGSSKLLAIWDVLDGEDRGVLTTLPGHDGIITCVRFTSVNSLVSADDKGELRFWTKCGSQWERTGCLSAHDGSISCLCVHDAFVMTGGSDSRVKIWRRSPGDQPALEPLQDITLKKSLPLSLAVTNLPRTKCQLLAIGGTDTQVQLWVRNEHKFVHSATLSGHEDWVRSLSFRDPVNTMPLILASGSQDATIRLWTVEEWKREPANSQNDSARGAIDDFLDSFEESLADIGDFDEGGKQISLKRHILTIKDHFGGSLQFAVTFDALLVGHDAGVTSLAWRPTCDLTIAPTLLSTSTDSSVILWSPSSRVTSDNLTTSVWINFQRFGDVGGQRLGGFVGGLWTQSGSDALSWGWAGGWRRWHCSGTGVSEVWTEVGAISGHNGPVRGIDWCPSGEYLISTGLDQTTRIHSPVPLAEGVASWHEIVRPQVHGYDLLNVAFIDALRFVSIADEKVARVFDAPRGFVDLVSNLGIALFSEAEYNRPIGANVPPLGLSNKAVADYNQATFPGLDLSKRPFESDLACSTLWPETEKIFGHGYESITLGMSNSRQFMATACRATTAQHAVVRVYDTTNFAAVGKPLQGHTLTVTRIAFSPDDKMILTVSRDRSWRLYERDESGGYIGIANDRSHARIIWDCAWSSEGDIFATASRDRTVRLWNHGAEKRAAVCTIKAKSAATAVAFAKRDLKERRRLAIGLESGEILVYRESLTTPDDWTQEQIISSELAHVDHIHRLAWRPTDEDKLELASCSEDGTMRVLILQTTI